MVTLKKSKHLMLCMFPNLRFCFLLNQICYGMKINKHKRWTLCVNQCQRSNNGICIIDNDLYKIRNEECKQIFAIVIPIFFELTQAKLWHRN